MTATFLRGPALPRIILTAPDQPPAVQVIGLTLRFGKRLALDGVDLTVPQGAVYLLAGANGAGKTTLLGTLLNARRNYEGQVRVFDLDPQTDGPICRANIGHVPEGTEFGYRWMRIGELLAHHAEYHPTWDPQYADRLVKLLEIQLDYRLGQLSKGQARRVQLMLALAHRPPMLLLDEPTDGLDPVVRDEVLGLVSEHLADTGCTVLVSTHLVSELDRLADHVGVIKEGRLVAQLSRDALAERLRVYVADGPEGWDGPDDQTGVLKQSRLGRQIQWTVWGTEAEVRNRIEHSGGLVREVTALTLTDAVVTLMRAEIQR